MSSRIRSIACLSLLSWLTLVFSSCTRPNTLELNSNDKGALSQLYEKSGWSFRKSHIGLKATGDGAVEVEIEGQAIPKSDNQTGPLLLSVVLTRELPNYFRLKEGTIPGTTELLAYQAKDGLWCIAAEVPLPRFEPSPQPTPSANESNTGAASDNPPVETSTPSTTVKLAVLLVSPAFSDSLPLLIPAGDSRGSVDTVVSLPKGARFRELEVKGDTHTPIALAVMPPTLSPNEVMAAGRLMSGGVTAWDFSKLTYSTSPSDPVRPFNLSPRTVLVTFIVLGILAFGLFWIRAEQRVRNYTQLSSLWSRLRNQLMELRLEVERTSFGDGKVAVLHRLEELAPLEKSSQSFQPTLKQQEVLDGGDEIFGKLQAEFSSYMKKSDSEEGRAKVQRLAERARALEETCLHFRSAAAAASLRRRFVSYILYFLIALFLSLWLTNIVVRSQTTTRAPQSNSSTKFTVLSDLGLSVKPEASESNKVLVKVNFSPFATVPSKDGKEEVVIALGDNNNQQLESVAGKPETRVEITQKSRKKATASLKVNSIKPSDLIAAVSNPYVASVIPDKEFSAAINNASDVVLECLVQNAQILNDHNQSRWLHWFPFETISIQVPIELSQPAYLSRVDIERPSDYWGDVRLEGLIDLHNKKGEKSFIDAGADYRLNIGEQDSRANIPANKQFVLKADFQRTRWQRAFLTVGQLLIALLVGVLLGLAASRLRDTWKEAIMVALGVLTIPFVIRASVFSEYASLPPVTTGQGVTVFELFFFASFLVYGGVGILIARRFST